MRTSHPAAGGSPHDLACVVHVHSTFSDGTASVPEIIDAAGAAGADAVLLTDHDSRAATRFGLEGWHGGVLLLVGHEITTKRGHLLAFGIEQEVDHRGLSEVEICARVRAGGGFGFAAHPFSAGGRMSTTIIRPHPWSALTQCPACGIELWSLLTDTAERWKSPIDALRFLRQPELMMAGPPAENLARWDCLCALRRMPAIGGLDAHQSGFRIAGRVLSPLPNERYFKLLRTHVLLDHPPTHDLCADRGAIYGALREGRCYLAVDAIAPARGFDLWAVAPDGGRAEMGSEVRPGRWTLQARVPQPARLRLFRDGRCVQDTEGNGLVHDVDRPGVYRLQASIQTGPRERTWIVSNPLYVREPPVSP